jgi:hypothetical protein
VQQEQHTAQPRVQVSTVLESCTTPCAAEMTQSTAVSAVPSHPHSALEPAADHGQQEYHIAQPHQQFSSISIASYIVRQSCCLVFRRQLVGGMGPGVSVSPTGWGSGACRIS